MIAYHFVGKKLRNGSPIPPDGKWLRFKGEPVPCARGLYANVDPFDALQYATGDTLCLVEVPDPFEQVATRDYKGPATIADQGELVSVARRIIKRVNFREYLRYFARMRALSVVHLWDATDAVLDFLMTGHIRFLDRALKDMQRQKDCYFYGQAWCAVWAASFAILPSPTAAASAWTVTRETVFALSNWTTDDPSVRVAMRRAAITEARKEFNALVREAFS